MTRGVRILLAAALLAPVVSNGATADAPPQAPRGEPAPGGAQVAQPASPGQAGPAAPSAPAAPKPRAPQPIPPKADVADPSLPERRVIEDDQVRIEELRVRGQVRSVTVQSKLAGARPYELVVDRPGRDPSIYRGAAGQSRWSLLDF